MLSYQNCSVYESEGVEYFDQNQIEVYEQNQQKVLSSCTQLDVLELQNLFATSDIKINHGASQCKISVEDKKYSCGINPDLKDLFKYPEKAEQKEVNLIQHELLLPISEYQQLIFYKQKDQTISYASKKESSSSIWHCDSEFQDETLEEDIYYLSQILFYLQSK